MADLVVSEGYADVGYEYINVDDCWLEKTRGTRGELVADRKRFPRGMKALGEHVGFVIFSIEMHTYVCAGQFTDFTLFKSIRFIRVAWNLVFIKILAITRAPVTQALSAMPNKMLNFSLTGKSIMSNWTDAIRCHSIWTLAIQILVVNWTTPDVRWSIRAVGPSIRFTRALVLVKIYRIILCAVPSH